MMSELEDIWKDIRYFMAKKNEVSVNRLNREYHKKEIKNRLNPKKE